MVYVWLVFVASFAGSAAAWWRWPAHPARMCVGGAFGGAAGAAAGALIHPTLFLFENGVPFTLTVYAVIGAVCGGVVGLMSTGVRDAVNARRAPQP